MCVGRCCIATGYERTGRAVKNWGIRTRVLLLAMLPAMLIGVTLSAYLVIQVSADADRELFAYGHGLSRQLAAVSEFSAYSGDRAALGAVAAAALDETYITAVAIYDADGLPIASGGPQPTRLTSLPLGEQAALINSDEASLVFAAPILLQRFHSKDLLLAETRAPEVAVLGWVTLKVSRASMQLRKRQAVFIALFSTFLVLMVAGGLALALGRHVTRPILRLEDAVGKIQTGDLDVRVQADSGGDLQRLEEGMNAMAQALKESRDLLEMRIAAATAELEQKKNEAERANVAKSRFLAAASHDLRQPLHALTMFAADLRHEVVTPAQQRLSCQISDSAASISELLDALLDISRLDLAEIVPQVVAFPLVEIFGRLEPAYLRLAKAKGLRFACHTTSVWVEADAVLVERLLGNLVSNAIVYTARGGVLVVARRDGENVRIEVRDSGIGIAPEYQQVIFEEFFQVGNAGRVRGQGLGLGLAIVRRLAHIQGLTVTLRSAPGRGSVFGVVLPRASATSVQAVADTPAAQSVSGWSGRTLVLLRPETPSLVEVAALAKGWGLGIAWADRHDIDKVGTAGDVAAIVAMQEGVSTEFVERVAAHAIPSVLLGNAQALAHGAHLLGLPLRPARLRSLLNRLALPTA